MLVYITTQYNIGCGTWSPANTQAGCYKYFGGSAGMKSWEAARQECREEGYKEGVGEADLAYFETSQELQDVIGKHFQETKLVALTLGYL